MLFKVKDYIKITNRESGNREEKNIYELALQHTLAEIKDIKKNQEEKINESE